MATLITLVDGDVATVAPVNANFTALNTEIAGATRTGYTSSVSIGNVGGGEDTLHSWTIPAGTLSAVGDGLQIRSQVIFAANTNNKGVQFYIGSSAAYAMQAATIAPNNKGLLIDLTVFVRSVAAVNNLCVLGSTIISDIAGTNAALEIAHVAGGTSVSAGSLASALLLKFTGSATSTNDIVQTNTIISVFKAQ